MRILLVDDELGVLIALGDALRSEGYEVVTASDGEEAYGKVQVERPQIVVLDVMLPRLNGFQLCKRLRHEGNNLPILFLSAKTEETDVVLGLGFGADDCVTKPFGIREVVARVEAVLRRTAAPPPARPGLERLEIGDVVLDFARFEARRGTRPFELTPREFRILRYLAERRRCAILSWKLKRLQTPWFDGVGENNIKPPEKEPRCEVSCVRSRNARSRGC